MQKANSPEFQGFRQQEANFSQLPHQFIDLLPEIKSLAELKVLIYLLRHTWGYQEYATHKLISIDEFVHGRKRKDGTRMDGGTGLSEQGVRDGIEKAVEHCYMTVETDDSDRGRVKKSYALNMVNVVGSGVQSLEGGVQSLDLYPPKFVPRSEKETIERNLEKEDTAHGHDKLTADTLNPLKTAIHTTWKYRDWKVLTKGELKVINDAAHEFAQAGVTPELVPLLHKYARLQGWTGFTPMALVKHLSAALAWAQKHGNRLTKRALIAADRKERERQNELFSQQLDDWIEQNGNA